MSNAHFDTLKSEYAKANFNKMIFDSITLDLSEGGAEITLKIEEKYFHALGAIHGAVYFKLLDDAAYFAAASVVEGHFILTTSFNINILKPVNKGTIKAVGKLKFSSKNLWVAESTLYNEEGKQIAFGTGNFAKSKVPIDLGERG